MINKSLIYSINLYQKYLFPYKGYCCAYRVYHDDISCSEFAKNSIKNLGTLKAISVIKQRFKDCKISSEKIKEEKKCCESKGWKRLGDCGDCTYGSCAVLSFFD